MSYILILDCYYGYFKLVEKENCTVTLCKDYSYETYANVWVKDPVKHALIQYLTEFKNIIELESKDQLHSAITKHLGGTNYPEIHKAFTEVWSSKREYVLQSYQKFCKKYNIEYDYESHLNRMQQDELEDKITFIKQCIKEKLNKIHAYRNELTTLKARAKL